MTAPDHAPLTPEERALAERLRGLGGPDGPSAATDARILAAAATAAAPERSSRTPGRRRRARWLPGSAITAIGTAAAFVVAIGTAWQLRPLDRPSVRTPMQGDDVIVEVELPGPRDQRAPGTAAAGPSPLSNAVAPDPQSIASPGTWRAPELGAPAQVAPAPPTGRASPAVEPASAESSLTAQTGSASPSPADAPVDSTAGTQRSAATDAAGAAPLPSPPAADADHPRRATYTTAARAQPESHRERMPVPTAGPRREAVPPDLATVPVDADAALDPAAWLERIRARRDAGDLDGARASLRRIEQAHPRLRLPRDLRQLRDPAP